MMLAHPQIQTVFDFSESMVQTLVIEEPRFFRDFLRDIQLQIEGYEGTAVLSEKYEPIEMSKHAELIDSFLTFEINRKPLLTKLIARLEKQSVKDEFYFRTAELLAEAEKLIQDIAFDLPCDVVCSKMGMGSILRAVGPELPDDYENDLERLLDYMELTREFERDRLFVLVNLRSYYSDAAVEAFLQTVLSHEFHVFLVDSTSRERLSNEKRTSIDSDLCEF